jgi:hypothetical protein
MQAARRAFTAAARVYAPGLLRHRLHCQACAAGRAAAAGRTAAGAITTGVGYVRRASGTRAVARAVPVNREYSDPDVEPAYVNPGYGSARRGGWVRRGRHIVLTGV